MVMGQFWRVSFQLYLNSLAALNYTVLCTLLFWWRSFRKTSASSSPSTFFLQYGDKRFQVTSNPENGIFLPSPFTEHLSHKLSLKQNSSVDERPFFSRPAGSSSLPTLHRGAFCQFLFRWIYYGHSSKSTGKKTGIIYVCMYAEFDLHNLRYIQGVPG